MKWILIPLLSYSVPAQSPSKMVGGAGLGFFARQVRRLKFSAPEASYAQTPVISELDAFTVASYEATRGSRSPSLFGFQ